MRDFFAMLGGKRQGFATLRMEECGDLRAYYVSGRCEEGFDPEGAILCRAELWSSEAEYVAIQNRCEFWCRPVFGTDLSELPNRIQALLIRDGALWRYFLPVCDDPYKTVIRGCEGGFEIVSYTGVSSLTECRDQLALVAGEGREPHALMRRVAEEAARLLGGSLKMREQKKMPEIFEYLGWCSWDAFQIRVSHENLLEKAKEFRQKGVPVHYAILDDMWGDAPDLKKIPEDADFRTMVKGMHGSRLRSFEGAPERFPEGMGAAIADLKAAGIPKVGVWFPTTGYWKGFDPEGEAKEMEGLFAPVTEDERWVVIPEEKPALDYFDRLCGKVKAWGGDFVKVDNQGYLAKHYREVAPLGSAAHAIQGAIDRAARKHFDGALINCMGMPSECMFHRPESAVSRCSGDFLPENAEWFSKHVLQCSFNGLLQGQYYINDWDMWWTDDGQALKNSLCRAVSGGPIYVSDKLFRTRAEVLLPLCYEDGRILRCDDSAVPTADCLIGNPTKSGKAFKIVNRVGDARVMLALNLDEENRSVTGSVSLADVGLDCECVLYEYFSGEARVIRPDERLDLTLSDIHDLRLYTFVPKRETITPLGRIDKFIGIAAVTSFDGERVILYEGGDFAFWRETHTGGSLVTLKNTSKTFCV